MVRIIFEIYRLLVLIRNPISGELKEVIVVKIFIGILLITVAGCTTLQTLTATENTVTYEYNHQLDSSSYVAERANEYCATYGKQAEMRSRTISPNGNWHTDIFDCK